MDQSFNEAIRNFGPLRELTFLEGKEEHSFNENQRKQVLSINHLDPLITKCLEQTLLNNLKFAEAAEINPTVEAEPLLGELLVKHLLLITDLVQSRATTREIY